MSGNRLAIATVVLLGLLGLTVWQFQAREQEYGKPADVSVKLPKLKKDDVDELSVSVPGKPSVTLKKQDKSWRLVAPLTSAADQSAVDTALDKLTELEVVGVAATAAKNFAQLEVDEHKGVHVVAKQGGKPLADLWIGAYRSGNTMVREQGAKVAAGVKGSIKYPFDKDVKDWRDRTVVELDADEVKEVTFKNAAGVFRFVKDAGSYKQAPGDKPIKDFDGDQVKAMVGSAAHLRAVDFAAAGVTADSAGVGAAPSGEVAIVWAEEDGKPPQSVSLRVGQKQGDNYYAARESGDPIFLISSYAGEKLLPTADKFVKPAPPAASAPAPGPAPGGM